MNIEQKIKITDDEARALANLLHKRQAIEQWVQLVSKQGEARMQDLVAEGQKVWQDVARKYNLDLEKVGYELSTDGQHIIARFVRL